MDFQALGCRSETRTYNVLLRLRSGSVVTSALGVIVLLLLAPSGAPERFRRSRRAGKELDLLDPNAFLDLATSSLRVVGSEAPAYRKHLGCE